MRLFLWLGALLLLLTACGGQDTTQQHTQSTPAPLPPLPPIGVLPTGAAGAQATGAVPPNTRLQLTIGLATNRQALANDLAAIYDPNSPQYGHFLTNDEIASRYGAPQPMIDTLTNFLTSQGFQVLSVSSLRDALTVSATAGQIQQAFHISLQVFQQNGATFFGPMGQFAPPPGIDQIINYILGLSDFNKPMPKPPTPPAPPPACKGEQGVSPSQIAAAYNYTNAYQAGYTGKGITIGVVEFNDAVSQTDLNTFLSCTTGGKLHRSITQVDGGAKITDNDSTGEATLDFEYLSTLAPDAQLQEYQAAYCNLPVCGPDIPSFAQSYADILNKIAQDDRVQVVSTSWGGAEASFSGDEIHAIDQALQRLAAEGITVAAASGDCAAFDDGAYNKLAVDFPAADPYTLAVGGTLLQTDTHGRRTTEPAWASSNPDKSQCSNDWGTGGGLSIDFKQPSWQKGTGVKNQYSNGEREVPDVAAISLNVPLYLSGMWYSSGGTSLAAPVWAAGIALVDQGLLQHKKPQVGGPASFYQLANQGGSLHPFYDVTKGTNLFYPATAGFDLATGLGAPNIIDFGKALGAF